jgi:hypothetical protein
VWRDPRSRCARPPPSSESQTQRRGREPGPRAGASQFRAAHSPHPGGSGGGSPGPAGCATPPAASPGKRGGRARFLLGFLRLGPSSSPPRGSVGAAAPGLGGRGGGSGSTTTWPPDAGPRRPGSSGSGKGGASHSPPLPPRAAPNSASQVTRAPRSGPDLREGAPWSCVAGGFLCVCLCGWRDPFPPIVSSSSFNLKLVDTTVL